MKIGIFILSILVVCCCGEKKMIYFVIEKFFFQNFPYSDLVIEKSLHLLGSYGGFC